MGKGRLPLGRDVCRPRVRLLPSTGPRSFLATARNSPYGRFNWKPVLGEGQGRKRRMCDHSFEPILALVAVTLRTRITAVGCLARGPRGAGGEPRVELQGVAKEARHLRLLRRGAQIESRFVEAWRAYGAYRDTRALLGRSHCPGSIRRHHSPSPRRNRDDDPQGEGEGVRGGDRL
jgi:hypothetical protein